MQTAIHRMAPARLGPLQSLLEQFARFLGLDGGRDFDDAFDDDDDRDFDGGGHASAARDHVRRFLRSLAGHGIGLLDAGGGLLIDAGELAEASSGPRGLMELLVTRALGELDGLALGHARPSRRAAPPASREDPELVQLRAEVARLETVNLEARLADEVLAANRSL